MIELRWKRVSSIPPYGTVTTVVSDDGFKLPEYAVLQYRDYKEYHVNGIPVVEGDPDWKDVEATDWKDVEVSDES